MSDRLGRLLLVTLEAARVNAICPCSRQLSGPGGAHERVELRRT
jgi:hypothetical protein